MDAANSGPARRTADTADAFLRRQAVHKQLLHSFRIDRPDDSALNRVSTVAEVAIDTVFAALGLSEEQQVILHQSVKDYAECASLYGYQLGLLTARAEFARARAE